MSNFTELSQVHLAPGENAQFLVRWRGKQEGPYSAELIEEKLSANEIGLLHEILHNGQWITIRDFLSEQETALRVQRQMREEQERHARTEQERREREEAERNAREQEERVQLQAAMLVEQQRKKDLPPQKQDSGVCCPRCKSTQIAGHKQGFDVRKAVLGDLLLGPVGLLGGMIGGDQIKITCLKCGHVFAPGQSW
jgi:ribosomal protein S27E